VMCRNSCGMLVLLMFVLTY